MTYIQTIYRPIKHRLLVDRDPDDVALFVEAFTTISLEELVDPEVFQVTHDADQFCCGREPWLQTIRALIPELAQDEGGSSHAME